MRWFACWFLWGFASLAVGQMDVSSSIPSNRFLVYEGVPLRLEITNRSGEVLQFGGEEPNAELLLGVKDVRSRIIPRTDRPFLKEPWVIPPGETSSHEFDLVQLFLIRKPDSYRSTTSVVPKNGQALSGKPELFEVTNGMLQLQVKSRKADRVFSMIGIHRNGRDELMLRVSNYNESMQLATYFLERHLRLYPPHMEMNSKGEVATLHYDSPYRVVLCRFNPEGTPINRTYFKASPGVPVRLYDHPDEGFHVEGANRIEVTNDGPDGDE